MTPPHDWIGDDVPWLQRLTTAAPFSKLALRAEAT